MKLQAHACVLAVSSSVWFICQRHDHFEFNPLILSLSLSLLESQYSERLDVRDKMAPQRIPYLKKTVHSHQLIVDDKPFLMRAAELQNSSLSSAEFMSKQWQKLVDTNINTVLGPVTWETMEPEEGKFDFTELDDVILGARKYELRLVLLWFGSFKNGQPI
jgi:hypothetical protein